MSKHNPFLSNKDMSLNQAANDTDRLIEFIEHRQGEQKKAEALGRLMRNKDFKTVVLDGFCKENVLRALGLSAVHEDPHTAKIALAEAQAATHLEGYFANIISEGRNAEASIAGAESELRAIDEEQKAAQAALNRDPASAQAE